MAEEASPRQVTEHDVRRFAASLTQSDEYKAILRTMKNDIIRKWANEQDIDERDALWHRIQAVGELEMAVQTLADGNKIDVRKAGG